MSMHGEESDLTGLPEPARRHYRRTEKVNRELRAEIERLRSASPETASDDFDELVALRQELAAMRAGIDLATPLGQVFARGYEGDWEPDALKAAWGTLGQGAPSEADGEGAPDALRQENDRLRAKLQIERNESMAGQANLGPHPSDMRPPANPHDRFLGDLAEARDKLTATDLHGALEQGKAVLREVMHKHGRILADEVD